MSPIAVLFSFQFGSWESWAFLVCLVLLAMLVGALALKHQVSRLRSLWRQHKTGDRANRIKELMAGLSKEQIDRVLKARNRSLLWFLAIAMATLAPTHAALAQDARPDAGTLKPDAGTLLSHTGILITVVLLLVPVFLGIAVLAFKARRTAKAQRDAVNLDDADDLADYLAEAKTDDIDKELEARKTALDYHLPPAPLSGGKEAVDLRGLLQVDTGTVPSVVARKRKAPPRPGLDAGLSKLILWYLGSAAFWLVLGTTVGEYLGIKFVAPDADHLSWLSFGRLRPVHTNMVFWGWASLGMLGLGNYVVPRVSNTPLASLKLGWWSLWLTNAQVLLGTLCLMSGINNGGGEYREYIWPVQLLFGIALALTLINFLRTIARRKTKEIYLSNWYIVSALIFVLVISLVAYLPFWQNGLGETIVQGYYMHQGVGMWFMLFTLGIVYYFLPQQLNRPIYSYSLGILAFWTQILFYTTIGTHHFEFSAIPWWLQTIAIVGSVGMIIPVIAGTTNFLMTFRGGWYKLRDSYTLPFFLTGVVFYFTGSMQGTAEAFRSTNLMWHFTDFTVAHSHLTMYGIISFFIWAGAYALIPRLTTREAPQLTIGAHFWLALLGLLFYTV
ncbi:MAG TPA: cbb3-type cytochrome c oxidase subunit I, partial [Puia sp.]|nr:cbb3-type cytochrome c oxidase subunit I [Puia sp.]